jgi:hypothetical protein
MGQLLANDHLAALPGLQCSSDVPARRRGMERIRQRAEDTPPVASQSHSAIQLLHSPCR